MSTLDEDIDAMFAEVAKKQARRPAPAAPVPARRDTTLDEDIEALLAKASANQPPQKTQFERVLGEVGKTLGSPMVNKPMVTRAQRLIDTNKNIIDNMIKQKEAAVAGGPEYRKEIQHVAEKYPYAFELPKFLSTKEAVQKFVKGAGAEQKQKETTIDEDIEALLANAEQKKKETTLDEDIEALLAKATGKQIPANPETNPAEWASQQMNQLEQINKALLPPKPKTPSAAEIYSRGVKFQMEHQNPTVLDAVTYPIGRLYAGGAGFVQGFSDAIQKIITSDKSLSREEIDELKKLPFKSAWESVTETPGSVQGLGDVYVRALRKVFGAEETPALDVVARILGLVNELSLPLPLPAKSPQYVNVGRQISKATGVSKVEAVRAAKVIMEGATHPERFAEVIDVVRSTGGEEAVRRLLKMTGAEGEALGAGPIAQHLIPKAPLSEYGATPLPPGARSPAVPISIRKAAEEFSWGAGLPPGGKEMMRSLVSEPIARMQEVPEIGKAIKKGLGKRGEEYAILTDLKSNLNALDKYRRLAKAPEGAVEASLKAEAIDKLPKLEEAFQSHMKAASERLGQEINEEAVRAGFQYGKRAEAERIADVGIRNLLDGMVQEANSAGANVRMLEDYMPRIETKESRERWARIFGRRNDKSRSGFQKARNEFTSLVNGGPHDFIENTSAIAERYRGHISLVGAAKAEEGVLKTYARPVPAEWLTPDGKISKYGVEQLDKMGLSVYEPKVNVRMKEASNMYVIDPMMKDALERVTSPEKAKSLWPALKKISNVFNLSWKSQATLLRPGFTARNMYSNGITYWVFDGGMKELGSAANILVKQALEPNALKKHAGIKGRLTPRELEEIALAEKHGVLGQGMVSYDLSNIERLGETSILQRINPLSSEFAHIPAMRSLNSFIEETFRLGLFKTMLNKGMSAPEAAQVVARAFVNYPEISKTGQVMRQIFPFFRWSWGNWGQQIVNYFERPAKMVKQFRAIGGIQGLDPLTQEEEMLASYIPDREYKGTMTVPFMRSDRGERMNLLGGGLLPAYAVNQLAQPTRTAREMLGPVPSLFVDIAVPKEGPEITMPLAPFSSPTAASKSYRRLDRASEALMNALDAAPNVKRYIMDTLDIVPSYDPIAYLKNKKEGMDKAHAVGLTGEQANDYANDYANRNTLNIGYKWKGVVPDVINRISPLVGTIMRSSRYSDEQLYDIITSLVAGLKAYPWGTKQAFETVQDEVQMAKDALEDARRKAEAAGEKIPAFINRMGRR